MTPFKTDHDYREIARNDANYLLRKAGRLRVNALSMSQTADDWLDFWAHAHRVKAMARDLEWEAFKAQQLHHDITARMARRARLN